MKNSLLVFAGLLAFSMQAAAQSPASDWLRVSEFKGLVTDFRDARQTVSVQGDNASAPANASAKTPANASAKSPAKSPAKRWAKLKYDPACVLATVADMMGITLKADIPAPAVLIESETPLKRFQDAVEGQWKMRPDMFLNAYTPQTNEVYLMADASYYEKLKRFLDDSLAHEYVHFFQVKYKNFPIDEFSDAEEGQAIDYQTRFRDEYMTPGIVPPRCR
ncbi:MAG: hypothetical protein WC943_06580 [Elusimicrobiota bacterium]